MWQLGTQVISIGTLLTGIIPTLVGLAGLVLPIIPGSVLILAGLWMIGRVTKHPFLEQIQAYVKQHASNITKKDSERMTGR